MAMGNPHCRQPPLNSSQIYRQAKAMQVATGLSKLEKVRPHGLLKGKTIQIVLLVWDRVPAMTKDTAPSAGN